MKEDAMVITTDDMMSYYIEYADLIRNYNDIIYTYKFKEHFGKGGIERIILNRNLEIWNIDYCFNREILMLYDMPQDCFEIACCISGEMEHFESSINKLTILNGGKLSVFAKKKASGYIKYLKDKPYKGMTIVSNKGYVMDQLNRYSNKESYRWHSMAEQWLDALYMGLPVSPKEHSIIEDIALCDMNDDCRLMFLESKCNEFIALKYNEITNGSKGIDDFNMSKYDIDRIYEARRILIEQMINPPSILELSKQVCINSTKLKQGFKLVYNNTVFGVLRDTRLEYSKTLLFNKELTIASIANKVGYSNPSKFSKAFKTKYGVNPRDIR